MHLNTVILILFTIGAFQGVLLAFLLLAKYKSDQSWYLSLISLLFGILICYYVAFWAQIQLPVYLHWVQYLTFIIAPFFYLLIAGIPFRKAFQPIYLLHFLPFAVSFALLYLPLTPMLLFICQPLHLVIYAFACYLLPNSRKPKVKQWVLLPLVAYAVLFVAYSIMVYMQTLTLEVDYLIAALSCGFIYALLIKSYLQPHFIKQLNAEEKISNYVTDTLLSRLDTYFEKHKPYLNGEYRLKDLANDLAVKPYQLSEIINLKYQGFNQLLNDRRVKEAISLLNTTDAKIIDVAFMSGFNNKVSFYKAFKRATGKTPVEWRQSTLKSVNISTG